jgi:catechol 2,3-dioxygenase-like lactoylglutathione lyase family enzyme
MPSLTGVLETALYVENVARSAQFYQTVFQLEILTADERFCAMSVAGRQVLLLFKQGASTVAMPTPGGVIPPHDGKGTTHLAFAITAAELPAWESWLHEAQIPIESKVVWPRGGQSVYFRDPDNHLLELATPGVWAIY